MLTHIGEAEPTWFGPMAITIPPGSNFLYVAGARGRQLAVIDLHQRKKINAFNLGQQPTGLSWAPKQAALVVTCSEVTNAVEYRDPVEGTMLSSLPAGAGVCSPVCSKEGAALYVCNRYENLVRSYSGSTLSWSSEAVVSREPVSIALSADGDSLVAANLLLARAATDFPVSALVSVLDAHSLAPRTQLALPNGSTSVRAAACHPSRAICAVVHNLARFQAPTTQVENGWMNVSAMTLIGLSPDRIMATVLLDEPRRGAANPSAVAWSSDGTYLCITHAGTHELSIINFPELERQLSGKPEGSLVADLTFLNKCRTRVQLFGNGPRAVAIKDETAYVAEYFSDSITAVDIRSASALYQIPISQGGAITAEREGERLFNDATICHQQWQSCATCHPDGRVDGFNWDLLNDGIGNPKNTKSMVFAHITPPAMSTGVRETAETAVRSGLRHILYAVRPESDARAIDAYLRHLTPVSSPHLLNGGLSPAAQKGKAIFESDSTGCVRCHPAPLWTDLKQHDVGTSKTSRGKTPKLDTPSLIELWRTAPYLHDGSAQTVLDVLTGTNEKQRHGNTRQLSSEELKELCEYLISL